MFAAADSRVAAALEITFALGGFGGVACLLVLQDDRSSKLAGE